MRPSLSNDRILEAQRAAANNIVRKLNAVKMTTQVAVAIEMIALRMTASGESLVVLRKSAVHDYRFDAASILRNIYDVVLQGLYILHEPSKREKRAQLYLDFMDVERKKRIDLMDTCDTDLARRVSQSHKRSIAQPEIEKRFDAVKAKYMTKKGDKVRDTWYPGTLADLAKATGLEQEYKLMQKFLSGVVHSSPLTLEEGPLVDDFHLIDWHWRFAFRILGAYAEYKGIALDETEQGLVEAARKNVFDRC